MAETSFKGGKVSAVRVWRRKSEADLEVREDRGNFEEGFARACVARARPNRLRPIVPDLA